MLMLCQVRMFRKTAWRNTPSEVMTLHQLRVLNTSMLLLRSYGPTGFLLRDEGECAGSAPEMTHILPANVLLFVTMLRFSWVTHIPVPDLCSSRSWSPASTSVDITDKKEGIAIDERFNIFF